MPVIENGYLALPEGPGLGIDLEANRVAWTYDSPHGDFPFYASAAATSEVVIVGGRDKLVHALNPKTGKALWTYDMKARIDASPVVAGDVVFVASKSGELSSLNLKTGSLVWKFETGSPIVASPSISNGRLVIGTLDGTVYAFGAKQIIAPL